MMMMLKRLLGEPWVERLGWTLLHSLWQGLVVALLLLAALAMLRRRAPQARYGAACAALVALLGALVATFALVRVESPAPRADVASAVAPALRPAVVPAVSRLERTMTAPAVAMPMPIGPPVVPPPPAPWSARLAGTVKPALPWLVMGWVLGVGILLAWHVGGAARLRRLRRRGTAPVQTSSRVMCDRLMGRLRLRRPVALLQSALVEVPTVLGWLKPVILLPAGALVGLTPGQLEALLAHELAHIRRHDYVVNLLQTAAETLLFYHPAVWWMSRRIRQEREHCCDDVAARVCGDKLLYARALATMEELRATAPLPALAARGGLLLPRIRRILGIEEERTMVASRPTFAVALVIGLLIAAIGWQLSAKAQPQERPAAAAVARSAATQPATKPADSAAPVLSFGPIIKRTLPRGADRKDWAIDLDSGQLFDVPREFYRLFDRELLKELKAWTAERGVDLIFAEDNMTFQLAVNTASWDSTAREVYESVRDFDGGTPGFLRFRERDFSFGRTRTGATRATTGPFTSPPYTSYSFKTREGGVGILRFILSDPDGYRGDFPSPVVIEYRMVLQAAPAATTARAADEEFGAVVEAVLPGFTKGPKGRITEVLDLDTGRRLTKDNFGSNDRETHRWLRDSGLDVLGWTERGRFGLFACDVAVLPVKPEAWDNLTPRELRDNAVLAQQEPNKITPVPHPEDPPGDRPTVLFRTREEGLGILQILGLSDDKNGVKVRYKLLPGATTQAANAGGVHIRAAGDKVRIESDGRVLEANRVDIFPAVKEPATRPASRPAAVPAGAEDKLRGWVDDFFRHNYRDITDRKTLEWGEPQTRDLGNWSIRYKFDAVIWDKDILTMNQAFTFTPDGKFVSVKNVEGFPVVRGAVAPATRPAVADDQIEPALHQWVETFFTRNYRDITARRTIEWGKPQKRPGGNWQIVYKYEATIWGKDKILSHKLFTFTPSGGFVEVKDADAPATKPAATQPGALETRKIDKPVADFAKARDLSTPESALAALYRARGAEDAQGVIELSWVKVDPRDLERAWKQGDPKDPAIYRRAQLDARVIEVMTYKGDVAGVITLLKFPPGVGHDPYSLRMFGRINGEWKNLGEDPCPSLEAAEEDFGRKTDALWEYFQTVKADVKPPEPKADAPATTQAAARLQIRLVDEKDGPDPADLLPDPNDATGQTKLRVLKDVLLDERAVATAARTVDRGQTQVSVKFTDDGAKRFEEITRAHLNQRLAIVFDGRLLVAPTIRAVMRADAVISGGANGLTAADADALVKALNADRARAIGPATTQSAHWGEATDGVRAGLRAQQDRWPAGQAPVVLASVRYDGQRDDLSVYQTPMLNELQWDGVWYHWAGEIRAKSSWLAPGRQYDDIPFPLDGPWRDKNDRAPQLSPGKHEVRVAFHASVGGTGDPIIRAISNPLSLEIAAPASRP